MKPLFRIKFSAPVLCNGLAHLPRVVGTAAGLQSLHIVVVMVAHACFVAVGLEEAVGACGNCPSLLQQKSKLRAKVIPATIDSTKKPITVKSMKLTLQGFQPGFFPAIASCRPFPEQLSVRVCSEHLHQEGYEQLEHSSFFAPELLQVLLLLNGPVVQRSPGAPVCASC